MCVCVCCIDNVKRSIAPSRPKDGLRLSLVTYVVLPSLQDGHIHEKEAVRSPTQRHFRMQQTGISRARR